MTTALTARQRAVYDAARRLADGQGYAPSLKELARATQLSVARIRQHLARLESLGVVERDVATARSLRLVSPEP